MQTLPDRVISNLSYATQTAVSQLPEEARQDFFDQYYKQRKDTLITYILQIFVYAPYGYLNEWVKQLLYWITAGGFGLWWLINFFRIPKKVSRYNQRLADRILKDVSMRHRLATKAAKSRAHTLQNTSPPKPRNIETTYDPANLTPENLQVGYMLDYAFKTWKVTNQWQFDWTDNTSEKCFWIVSDLEKRNIYLEKENTHLRILETKDISIHTLDANLERELIANLRPSNSITYEGICYYRERNKAGRRFQIPGELPQKRNLKMWEYLDETRSRVIRIEQYADHQFNTSVGATVSPIKFSDILPGNI